MFSAGGSDLSVNMWRVAVETASAKAQQLNYGSLSGEEGLVIRGGVDEAGASTAPSSLAPFFSLLEGGEGGELHHDIVDYFYYCQLRNLGEDSMEQRNLAGGVFHVLLFWMCLTIRAGVIPLEEIPSLVRSVGFYPSEEEVANMVNEVRRRSAIMACCIDSTITQVRYKHFLSTGETQDFIGLVPAILLRVQKYYLNLIFFARRRS